MILEPLIVASVASWLNLKTPLVGSNSKEGEQADCGSAGTSWLEAFGELLALGESCWVEPPEEALL